MEKIKITQSEFDSITTNYAGILPKEGLVMKKKSSDEQGFEIWVQYTYVKDNKDGTYEFDIKQIEIIK